MFSSALKSISATNITANYSVATSPTSTAGPWKIYDAKKKSTGKTYSVFVFDKKSLDAHSSSLGRSGAAAFKRSVEEVVERLKKEASSLAKLRHPCILELVEPVEDTRGGGLQFVTEAVTASLASALQEKDDQERSGGPGGRSSRYVTEDSDGVRRRRELEIDELEIQKGLLQISKALEFLHDNAGLVHGNLTPDAILINSKSDWKISGLSFCSPVENSTKPTSITGISLHEVLNLDPRLPKFVQLNLDYTSPDFVLDNNLTSSADMFSLGLLSVALYNSPHRSPLETNGSVSSYKRLFSSSQLPSSTNNYHASRPIPRDLTNIVLPRLITRRPAQRMTAREFQESEYFDNILVSTIRFLDAFPEKTAQEKGQFLRGLNKVLPSFPKSVMEKKVLPALLEELKDKDLTSLILQNAFKIMSLLPSARRAFGERLRPALKDIFIANAKASSEKDAARDAGLMVVLENLSLAAENSSGKEFKDDMLPILLTAIECPTHSIVDAALRSVPMVLPVLDFTTIKNELFPIIASVFSKTNSLAIKVRGLQAFVILCGGSSEAALDDGLNGLIAEPKKTTSSSTALDKYTMQEKIVPLIRAIKTKEPAVMMAALNVLRIIGQFADAEFVAMELLPILWSMSLGPLLELKQFETFMDLIKSLSKRVEDEQTRKLQDMAGTSNGGMAAAKEDFLAFGGVSGTAFDQANGATEDDFESLVKGRTSTTTAPANNSSNAFPSWDDAAPSRTTAPPTSSTPHTPAFSWSTPSPTSPAIPAGNVMAQKPSYRTVTPDLGRFESMTPSSTQFSQPMQPTQSSFQTSPPPPPQQQAPSSSSINWSSTPAVASNPWAATSPQPNYTPNQAVSPGSGFGGGMNAMSNLALGQQRPAMGESRGSSFSLPPPPGSAGPTQTSFGIAPPPAVPQQSNVWAADGSMNQRPTSLGGAMNAMNLGGGGIPPAVVSPPPQQQQQQQQQRKSGLAKYESLI